MVCVHNNHPPLLSYQFISGMNLCIILFDTHIFIYAYESIDICFVLIDLDRDWIDLR